MGITLIMAFPKTANSLTKPYEQELTIELRGYENYATVSQIYAKKTQTTYFDPCSCVSLAKSLIHYGERVGLARNWPRNTDIPAVGEVVILNESPQGHVATITQVWADEFKVDEANYKPCERSQRTIKINDPDILGYWYNEN